MAIRTTLAAGEAALAAIFPTARDHMTFPELLEDGLEPHKVAEAWIMGHPEPDTWIDVTDHLDTAIEALSGPRIPGQRPGAGRGGPHDAQMAQGEGRRQGYAVR